MIAFDGLIDAPNAPLENTYTITGALTSSLVMLKNKWMPHKGVQSMSVACSFGVYSTRVRRGEARCRLTPLLSDYYTSWTIMSLSLVPAFFASGTAKETNYYEHEQVVHADNVRKEHLEVDAASEEKTYKKSGAPEAT